MHIFSTFPSHPRLSFFPSLSLTGINSSGPPSPSPNLPDTITDNTMAIKDDAKVESGPANHSEYGAYSAQVELIDAAVATSEAETLLPRKELFKRYWPAAVYSMLLSLALVMEGMDVGLINNFFAHPAYLARFGWPDAKGVQHISTQWQGAIGAGNNIGSIMGLLVNGYLQSRFGSRRVYMVTYAPLY